MCAWATTSSKAAPQQRMRWGSYLADRKEGVRISGRIKIKNNNTQTDKRGREGKRRGAWSWIMWVNSGSFPQRYPRLSPWRWGLQVSAGLSSVISDRWTRRPRPQSASYLLHMSPTERPLLVSIYVAAEHSGKCGSAYTCAAHEYPSLQS